MTYTDARATQSQSKLTENVIGCCRNSRSTEEEDDDDDEQEQASKMMKHRASQA